MPQLLPQIEKIHQFLYIVPIFENKVTFLAKDIYNYDKSPLTQLNVKNLPYLGHFPTNFAHLSSFFKSHWIKWPTRFFFYICVFFLFCFVLSYSLKYTYWRDIEQKIIEFQCTEVHFLGRRCNSTVVPRVFTKSDF